MSWDCVWLCRGGRLWPCASVGRGPLLVGRVIDTSRFALPSWGEAVALWVEVVSPARREAPLDLGERDHRSLDVVRDANDDHNI